MTRIHVFIDIKVTLCKIQDTGGKVNEKMKKWFSKRGSTENRNKYSKKERKKERKKSL